MNQVFSTEISHGTRVAWEYWANHKHESPIKKNQAWLSFAHECDKEKKNPVQVSAQLSKHH